MCYDLLNLKLFCLKHAHKLKKCNLSVKEWNFLTDFVKGFGPVYNATIQLQQEDLVFTQLYAIWLETKLIVEKMKSTSKISEILSDNLCSRQKNLIENELFQVALFLDPKFHLTLDDGAKSNAIKNLKKIVQQYFDIQQTTSINQQISEENEIETNSNNYQDSKNILMSYLQNIAAKKKYETEPELKKKIFQRIDNMKLNFAYEDAIQHHSHLKME
jgi:hypothetical protein